MTMGKLIERDGKQKLYVQVYDILKASVEQGQWLVSSMIPTEDELCRMYDVSKATIREAIAELVRDGYVRRQQGKGTFVICAEPHRGVAMRTRITENLVGSETTFNIEIIATGIMAPTEDIKIYLQTEEDLQYIFTKRLVGGKAVFIDETYFPCSLFPDISVDDIVHKSIYDLVDGKAGSKIVKVLQTIEVVRITADKTAILDTEEGSPALQIHRIIVGSDGKPMAYTRLIGSGSKYKMQMEFVGIR